jgi:hypothetical protein
MVYEYARGIAGCNALKVLADFAQVPVVVEVLGPAPKDELTQWSDVFAGVAHLVSPSSCNQAVVLSVEVEETASETFDHTAHRWMCSPIAL